MSMTPPDAPSDTTRDEGGLRAPPSLSTWGKAWWWFDFLILVKLARLRFIAILVAIGFVITQWDTLMAYYEKWTRPATGAVGAASDIEYFCPMHPAVVRDNPREKCPICFMPLSKRKKGEQSTEALPAGVVNRVQLSPYRVVLAGVQTWEVAAIPLTKQIEAVGFVEFNERGLKNVSARVKGRVDELLVNETGQMVAEGDVLASLYSPDLNVTVQNLLDARKRKNTELEASARQRLQLLGISDDQTDEILRTGKANSHLRIRSPISGHVIKKSVREGQYVEEGSPLYEVADLSTIWIQAQIYEDDMAFLPLEQAHRITEPLPVTAVTRALPGEIFRGALTFIYPHVDQQSRTVTVRFELDNPGHKLRPGTTASVMLQIPPDHVPALKLVAEQDAAMQQALVAGRVSAVPESAVIDTGSQTLVYRESLPGVFEGVLVTLGPKMTGPENVTYYPVLSGLALGDSVVTSGSFLVDAETRLNPAAGSIYFGGSGSKSTGGGVTVVRPTTPENVDAKLLAALKKLPPVDRALAEQQQFCPVLENSRLGSMGVPVKLTVSGQPVFVCCPACESQALADPAATLKKIAAPKDKKPVSNYSPPAPPGGSNPEAETTIHAALAKLDAADRQRAEQQRFCVILPNSRLGSMGTPIKLDIDGQSVFVCCAACKSAALAKPQETLRKADELRRKHTVAPPLAAVLREPDVEIRAELLKLSRVEQEQVLGQRFCAVAPENRLGSMGPPITVLVEGKPVFLCCEGCRDAALEKPQETLAAAQRLREGHPLDEESRR